MTQREFNNTFVSLEIGIGVVVFLLTRLFILRLSQHDDDGIY
jgi:hypothetical protein